MPILHLIRGPVEGSLDARAEGRFAPCQHRELLHYAGGSIMAHVLIVDSHAGVREQLVRLLEQAGHAATAVATVSEAASMLPTLAPDLLATDAAPCRRSSPSTKRFIPPSPNSRTLNYHLRAFSHALAP